MKLKKIIAALTVGIVTVTGLAESVPVVFSDDQTWYQFSNSEKNRLNSPETTITVDYIGANDGWGDVGVGGFYNGEWVSYYFPCDLGENTLTFTVTELLEKISERYNEDMKEKEENTATDVDARLVVEESVTWIPSMSEEIHITGEGVYTFKIDDLEIDPDTLTVLYVKDAFAIENSLDLDEEYASKVSEDFSISFALKINDKDVAIADTFPGDMGDKTVFNFCFYNIWSDDDTYITLPEETINSIELVATVSEGESEQDEELGEGEGEESGEEGKEDGENEPEYEEIHFSVGEIDFQGVSSANGTTLISVTVERSEDDAVTTEYIFSEEEQEEFKKKNTEMIVECDSSVNSNVFEIVVIGKYDGYTLQSSSWYTDASDCKHYLSVKNILWQMSRYYNMFIKGEDESDMELSCEDVTLTRIIGMNNTLITDVSLSRRNQMKSYDAEYYLENIEGYLDISPDWGSAPYEKAKDYVWETDVYNGAALLCIDGTINFDNDSDYMIVVKAEVDDEPFVLWDMADNMWQILLGNKSWSLYKRDDCKMISVKGPSSYKGIVENFELFDVVYEDEKTVYTYAFKASDINQIPETGWYSQLQMYFAEKVTVTVGYAKISEEDADEEEEDKPCTSLTDNDVIVEIPEGSEAVLDKKTLEVEKNDSDKDTVSYNITLKDKDGNDVQPGGNVTVKIPLSEGWNGEKTIVSRVEEDGSLTDMKAVFEDGYMVFTTDHFSKYVLSQKPDVKIADINSDGKITTVDAKWVLQAVSGSRTLTPEQMAAADVNGDGKITTVDAKWILQVISGSRVLS